MQDECGQSGIMQATVGDDSGSYKGTASLALMPTHSPRLCGGSRANTHIHTHTHIRTPAHAEFVLVRCEHGDYEGAEFVVDPSFREQFSIPQVWYWLYAYVYDYMYICVQLCCVLGWTPASGSRSPSLR